jgi:hypothetical protein
MNRWHADMLVRFDEKRSHAELAPSCTGRTPPNRRLVWRPRPRLTTRCGAFRASSPLCRQGFGLPNLDIQIAGFARRDIATEA